MKRRRKRRAYRLRLREPVRGCELPKHEPERSIAPRPMPYQVTTTLGKGTRPTTMQPPVLFNGIAVGIGPFGSHSFPVPQDAGVISIMVTVGGSGIGPEDVLASQQMATGATGVEFFPVQDQTWVPLIPGATQVVLVNLVDHTVSANVIFGVEG